MLRDAFYYYAIIATNMLTSSSKPEMVYTKQLLSIYFFNPDSENHSTVSDFYYGNFLK